MRRFFLPVLTAFLLAACASTQTDQQQLAENNGTQLPAEFRNNQVFLQPAFANGVSLTFFTDSGGGFNALAEEARQRLGLPLAEPLEANGQETMTVAFPDFADGHGIPAPPADNWMQGRLVVVPGEQLREDGFLGGRYFGGRIWAFDYPAETVRLLDAVPEEAAAAISLGFQTDAETGKRTTNFPRMTVHVDGQAIDMLLDTGATVTLTDESGTVFGNPAGTRIGGSYIISSIFDAWRKAHPEWSVIEAGDGLRGRTFRMIRVPEIHIGERTTGPVWFTERPDKNFTEYMSRFMDQPVSGAIGGSALQYFRVVIDYPGARAWFSQPENPAGEQ